MDKEIRFIKGVGPQREKMLKRLRINSVRDLLFYFPSKYEDRTNLIEIADLKEKEAGLVLAECLTIRKRLSFKTRKTVVEAVFCDKSGRINVSWFNQPYIINNIEQGYMYYLYATPRLYKGKLQFVSPEFDPAFKDDEEGDGNKTIGILPFYGLTAGLKQSILRNIIASVVEEHVEEVEEFIPEAISIEYGFLSRAESLCQMHFPDSLEQLQKARERFIFEEFLLMQLFVCQRKLRFKEGSRSGIKVENDFIEKIKSNFGYELTESQQKVLDNILSDLKSDNRLSRLLQGDVGSGKTIVALIAAFCVARAGYQVACMAPTEVLAIQHVKTIDEISNDLGIKTSYLGASVSATERKKVYAGLKDGSIDIVVGTQALLTDKVNFNNLRFIIIDELHRFGVCQRALLGSKGENPDVLIMSATPIPRTLAMTMYGDLDVSYIDEYPKGRKLPSSAIVPEKYRERVYSVLDKKINEGRQAFIVYALVEDSEELDIQSAVTMYKSVVKRFKDKKVGLLHGRLKPVEKDSVLESFRSKQVDILVSTLVVEVGVDVPNATMMIVENPERFGLAQLHQLRGRIMRSNHESYFYMITHKGLSASSRERLKVIEQSNDGFAIAESDLKLRGPGDVFGIIQSGHLENKIADVKRDFKMLEEANKCAANILKLDPKLELLENSKLSKILEQRSHVYM